MGSRIAFTLIFNVSFILVVVGLVLGASGYILCSGQKFDRLIKKVGKLEIKLSLLIAVGIFLLFLIIGLIVGLLGGGTVFSEIDIYWYAVMIVTGMIVAIVFAMFHAKKKGMDPNIVLDLSIVVIPLGILGARVWFALFPYEGAGTSINTLAEFFDFRSGGLGIYGGIIFGGIAVVLVAYYKKISMLKLLDILAPSVLIAQAIGRWGNFFNQEAYGLLVENPIYQWFPFSVLIGTGANAEWHLATFFYEFLWNTIGFVLLMWFSLKKNKVDGLIICGYFAYYGLGRSSIEALRTDSLYIGSLRVSILFSIIMIVAAGVIGTLLVLYYRKHGKQFFDDFEKKHLKEKKTAGGKKTSTSKANLPKNDKEKNSSDTVNNDSKASDENKIKSSEEDSDE